MKQDFSASLAALAVPEFRHVPAVRLENACATGSAAVWAALDSIESCRVNRGNKRIKSPTKTKTQREKDIVYPTAINQSSPSPIEDLKAVVDELFEKNGEQFICKTCGKVSNRNSDIRKHVEIHIEGLSFECQFCLQSFRSRVILKQHKRIHKK